jgi:hypothetical protein
MLLSTVWGGLAQILYWMCTLAIANVQETLAHKVKPLAHIPPTVSDSFLVTWRMLPWPIQPKLNNNHSTGKRQTATPKNFRPCAWSRGGTAGTVMCWPRHIDMQKAQKLAIISKSSMTKPLWLQYRLVMARMLSWDVSW